MKLSMAIRQARQVRITNRRYEFVATKNSVRQALKRSLDKNTIETNEEDDLRFYLDGEKHLTIIMEN